MSRLKIVVGLSGGVDSSVAALRLQQQGYPVSGLFMKNWIDFADESECTAIQDSQDAQAITHLLGIPFYEANFSTEYWNQVFEHFLDEYRRGHTPNPDILCNREIKFKVFLNYALALGYDLIATGHYARIEHSKERYHLLKGQDKNKDQSYFLYTLNQKQLSHTLFPLGDLKKPEVRHIAATAQFPNYNKKDSTGICFIGERRFKEFLSRYLPAQPGDILTPEGEFIGKHDGLMYYTLGQRQGLGIGGRKNSSGNPWFVVGKNLMQNALYVAEDNPHYWLRSQTLQANQLHWIAGKSPAFPYRCAAKIRYRQADQACTLTEITHDSIQVTFDLTQYAATPGQAIVFYQNDECLGGGTIITTNALGLLL
ncbi:tRNA (5-methylaminomethyl-2-thiouridylate)-methyltransferase [Candidatus Nitrosoglobus terrae]|uniref:tRNA-specific 2-thiouridylase MnmA n=1 Tax=Candidatus Nitrosoglobus terrae TaxID=1630141 RepID=A0A1Q2SMJ7_9GAMM|nr:tRNA 2-thiouridine(34) synthase MnmA [Candidatus Nitrosoglobus terrae]BAW80319.1 tRNA (5-methylaminomethyl-2-thiouridylate)-methyltransferase [Candidatus Nitrosoglobus terrae]